MYRGAPLATVLDWYQYADVGLSEPAIRLRRSGTGRQRDADESARLSVERRQRSARRIAFTVLSVLTAAAVIASVVAFLALKQSRDKEAEAEQRLAHGLATQAESLASTQPKLALALAAEAGARLPQMPAEAQQAMVTARLALAATRSSPNGEPIPVGDVLTVIVTPDGSTIVTGSRDGTVNLWDTQTGEGTATLTGPTQGVEEAAIDPSGRWLVVAGADGLWRWDLHSKATEGDLVDRPSGALSCRRVLRGRPTTGNRIGGRRCPGL